MRACGVAVSPLYKSAPEAAQRDPQLYAALAYVDAIRLGRARERQVAVSETPSAFGTSMITAREQILARIELVARGFGELLDRMTFVGGATTALYIDDPGAPDVRPTQDVDCAVQVASYAEFAKLEVELRTLGFLHHPGGPICRWLWRDTVVDVMPTDEAILGFAKPMAP